jgi:hypothetical protein
MRMRLAMLHSHVGDYKNEHRSVRNIATLPKNTDQWCLRQIILVAQTSVVTGCSNSGNGSCINRKKLSMRLHKVVGRRGALGRDGGCAQLRSRLPVFSFSRHRSQSVLPLVLFRPAC